MRFPAKVKGETVVLLYVRILVTVGVLYLVFGINSHAETMNESVE